MIAPARWINSKHVTDLLARYRREDEAKAARELQRQQARLLAAAHATDEEHAAAAEAYYNALPSEPELDTVQRWRCGKCNRVGGESEFPHSADPQAGTYECANCGPVDGTHLEEVCECGYCGAELESKRDAEAWKHHQGQCKAEQAEVRRG